MTAWAATFMAFAASASTKQQAIASLIVALIYVFQMVSCYYIWLLLSVYYLFCMFYSTCFYCNICRYSVGFW